jgi:glycosyltransferase involved in cell wall biosynthesis
MTEKKIAIGFGPRTGMNSFYQSGLKVAGVLEQDKRFACGFFTHEPFVLNELMQFDVIIFIKYYPTISVLSALKRAGKKLILDYQDMFLYPSVYELNALKKIAKKLYYCREEYRIRRALALFDLCFVASPALMDIVQEAGIEPFFLQRQLYNDSNERHFRQHSDKKSGLVLYWTGVTVNQPQNDPVLPVLRNLSERYQCKIVYSTDSVGRHDFIEYTKWNRETWEQEMTEVDIAFRWRDLSNMQHYKDANKVMAYMGAGLPVVVYPTESEKRIIDSGVNGFMVYSVADFAAVMEHLITDPILRKTVGEKAHADVWDKYSLKAHVEQIKYVLSDLIGIGHFR